MPAFSSPFDLAGSDIWVIGGAGHLGVEVVSLLAAMGCRVLCADLDDRAQQMVASRSLSGEVTPCTLDVRDETAVQSFVREHATSRSAPHGLVNLTMVQPRKHSMI
jgi:NAD(P)-dependent dehydrogenase (short-subunit alcohol dehydrogenase family)